MMNYASGVVSFINCFTCYQNLQNSYLRYLEMRIVDNFPRSKMNSKYDQT